MFPIRWCCWWTLCLGGATCQASQWDKVSGLALKSSVVAGYALKLGEDISWALLLGQPWAVGRGLWQGSVIGSVMGHGLQVYTAVCGTGDYVPHFDWMAVLAPRLRRTTVVFCIQAGP